MLEQEGIVIADEGMGGWLIYKNVKGPHKRYRYRVEVFPAVWQSPKNGLSAILTAGARSVWQSTILISPNSILKIPKKIC